MDEIKVVHLPFYDDNAYQTLLMRHLAGQGFHAVAGGGGGTFFRTALRRWKARILHFHWLHPYMTTPTAFGTIKRSLSFLAQILVLRLAGQKIVWTAHNLKHHESRHPGLERFFLSLFVRCCHAIIAHGETAKSELAAFARLRHRGKISVIPHGNYIGCYPNDLSRAQARARLRLPADETQFLFLGQIRPYKGVLELLDAFDELAREDGGAKARLLIAGKPLDEASSHIISARAAQLNRVQYQPGFVPDERLQEYMNAADAVIFPYRDILTSGAVVLAMSFGRACVAPRLGCIGEILDERGGFPYDPADENGLLTALREAVRRCDELPRMGDHNRRLAEEWSWERIATMTAQIYRDCLKR